jgi:hypothetical protein
MKASKLLMAMVCCAMAMPVGAQESKPEQGKKNAHAAQPAGDKKGEMPAMGDEEKAWMEAGTPGKMHEWIAKGAGEWDCTVKMMMPEQPVQESKGKMSVKMVFDGRFSHGSFSSDFMGMPFQGVATLGYNNVTQKFEGTWIDSMSTGTMFMTGTLDAEGKSLTLIGEFADPMTKKMIQQRNVSTFKGDNQMVDEFYHKKDGKEAKVMEITYTRSKSGGKSPDAMEKKKGEDKPKN